MIHPIDRYMQLSRAGTLLETVEVPVLVWAAAAPALPESTREFTRPSMEDLKAQQKRAGDLVAFELAQMGEASNVVLIGRSSRCEVRLHDETVSRMHAQLEPTRYGWSVKDLGTKNGTWVGQLKVKLNEPATLVDGARIQVGNVELFFMLPESLAAYLSQLEKRLSPSR